MISKFKFHECTNEILTLSFDETKVKATKLSSEIDLYSTELLGTWIDPTDSFPTSIKTNGRAEVFLSNPFFEFKEDSFRIQTATWRGHGKWKMVGSKKDVIILETEAYYLQNILIRIQSVKSDSLTVHMDDFNAGSKELYFLTRQDQMVHNM